MKTKHLTIENLDLDSDFARPAQKPFVAKIQEKLDAGEPVRIIILKARQLGLSTATEGVLFNWCFIFPGCSALVLSKKTIDAEHLFEITKLMWDNWPFRHMFTEGHRSVRRLSWLETGSSMKIATAKGEEVGRGDTLHAVHCSEVAFYPDPETLFTSLNQAVPDLPGTIIVLESTANGEGDWFCDTWRAAEAGENDYIPMFFPWWIHEEYEIPGTTLSFRDLDEYERKLMKKHPEITLPKLAWRRWCIRNKCNGDVDMFMQEYPADPDEAFLTTGRNRFPLDKLEQCYSPREGATGFLTPIRDPTKPQGTFYRDRTGHLTIFKDPGPGKKYVVVGDPTRTTWGDPACIQVLNRWSYEQVAVWHGHIEPAEFADRLAELGYYYNTATVNCEIEGGGLATINLLTSKMFYPDVWRWRLADRMPGNISNTFGFSMNWQRKQMAAAFVIEMMAQGMLKIHDEETYEQLKDYVVLPNGELGPARASGHDDAVTSLMIAVSTIRLDLEMSRAPVEEMLQSHALDIGEGNVFAQTPAPTQQPGDLFGVPWWEAMDDGY